MNNASGKAVVITGASSGIGRASVSRMIEAGWKVFATVRKAEDGEKLRSEVGGETTPLIMDVTERSSINRAAEQLAREAPFGLDGLVNVAGIGMARPIEYVAAEDLRQIFEINVFGQLAVIQAFLPGIRKAHGRIVNITSIGAHIAIPFGSLINASKSAFGIFSDTLRLELHPFGIRVMDIQPGAINTPAVEKTLGDVDSVLAGLPTQGVAQYGQMLKTFVQRAYEREKSGSSPDVVAHAVHHALSAQRPQLRYRVGKHAKLLAALARIMPEGLLDSIRLRILGLPAQFGALEAQK